LNTFAIFCPLRKPFINKSLLIYGFLEIGR
jgi:hypothetical protein